MHFTAFFLGATAAVLTTSATAATVQLDFSRPAVTQRNTQFAGPNVYLPGQIAFSNAALADGVTWDFKFTYDTAAAGPNFGISVVSGRLGSITDFSAYTPTVQYTPNLGMLIKLEKLEFAGSSSYRTGAYFVLQDNDGQFGATPPGSFDFPNLDLATASFEIRRAGGVGQGHINVGFGTSVAIGGAPVGGGSPVPEPATWALMIGGFGLAGASVRRHRLHSILFA